MSKAAVDAAILASPTGRITVQTTNAGTSSFPGVPTTYDDYVAVQIDYQSQVFYIPYTNIAYIKPQG